MVMREKSLPTVSLVRQGWNRLQELTLVHRCIVWSKRWTRNRDTGGGLSVGTVWTTHTTNDCLRDGPTLLDHPTRDPSPSCSRHLSNSHSHPSVNPPMFLSGKRWTFFQNNTKWWPWRDFWHGSLHDTYVPRENDRRIDHFTEETFLWTWLPLILCPFSKYDHPSHDLRVGCMEQAKHMWASRCTWTETRMKVKCWVME